MAYFGNNQDNVVGGLDGRFFYGLRRTDDGELFFTKVDQMDPDASIKLISQATLQKTTVTLNKASTFLKDVIRTMTMFMKT